MCGGGDVRVTHIIYRVSHYVHEERKSWGGIGIGVGMEMGVRAMTGMLYLARKASGLPLALALLPPAKTRAKDPSMTTLLESLSRPRPGGGYQGSGRGESESVRSCAPLGRATNLH